MPNNGHQKEYIGAGDSSSAMVSNVVHCQSECFDTLKRANQFPLHWPLRRPAWFQESSVSFPSAGVVPITMLARPMSRVVKIDAVTGLKP